MAFWGGYVSVAQRQARAKRDIAKLRKAGKEVRPVAIEGRSIARSFWGKGWCAHMESFSDYASRLPRGRTYVRDGSVCHLEIANGVIEAWVSGTSMYEVRLEVAPLSRDLWERIKTQCSGQIASMLELLKGKLSDQVMRSVTDRREGLFPLPGQIKLRCSCPDSARMCKHIAATVYGVGHRLDSQPELLFVLRGVDPMELLTAPIALPSASSAEVLESHLLGDIFGIDLEEGADEIAVYNPFAAMAEEPVTLSPAPAQQWTGDRVTRLRGHLGISAAELARRLEVSPASITRWESVAGELSLRKRPLEALDRLAKSSRFV